MASLQDQVDPTRTNDIAERRKAYLRRKRRHNRKHFFLFMTASLVLIFWLKITYIFILIALMPSIISYFIEMSSTRSPFKTVFACNLAGLIPLLIDLILQGNSPAMVMNMMASINTWVIVYGSALLGWLLITAAPLATTFFIEFVNKTYVTRLRDQQKDLMEEWGPEIRRRRSIGEEILLDEEEEKPADAAQ